MVEVHEADAAEAELRKRRLDDMPVRSARRRRLCGLEDCPEQRRNKQLKKNAVKDQVREPLADRGRYPGPGRQGGDRGAGRSRIQRQKCGDGGPRRERGTSSPARRRRGPPSANVARASSAVSIGGGGRNNPLLTVGPLTLGANSETCASRSTSGSPPRPRRRAKGYVPVEQQQRRTRRVGRQTTTTVEQNTAIGASASSTEQPPLHRPEHDHRGRLRLHGKRTPGSCKVDVWPSGPSAAQGRQSPGDQCRGRPGGEDARRRVPMHYLPHSTSPPAPRGAAG